MTMLWAETPRDMMTRLSEELRREESKRQKGERLKPQVLRKLAWNADALAGITLAAWEWVRQTLAEKGFEGRELAGHCRLLLEGIDLELAWYEQLLAWAEESSLTPEAAGLRGLEAKLPDLREARPKVAEILELATRPPQPIDEIPGLSPERVKEALEALERGEGHSHAEIFARLRRRP
jgi:hypothetical protein